MHWSPMDFLWIIAYILLLLSSVLIRLSDQHWKTSRAAVALYSQSLFCRRAEFQSAGICCMSPPSGPVSAATHHFSICQNWQWHLWDVSRHSDRNITDKVNSLQAKSCKKHLVTSQRCKKKSVKQLNIDGKLTMIASAVILSEFIQRGIWHGQQCFMSILSDAEESCLFKQRYGGI